LAPSPRCRRALPSCALAPERYEVRFTASAETCAKLKRAQDLLRHAVPAATPPHSGARHDGAMMRAMKRILLVLLALVVAVFAFAPAAVERHYNTVPSGPHPPPSARAIALHRRLTIVDLHADSLLWARDLGQRSTRGHVDVPRLIEGNVAIEAFTVVTKSPRGLNNQRNDDQSDLITALAVVERWPPRTWTSLRERALFQAHELQETAERSDGRLTLLRTRDDVTRYLERRRTQPAITAGLLGLEGAHALEGDLASVDTLTTPASA
jgi:hypothetical protein